MLASTVGITERGDGARYRFDVTVGANFDDGRGNAVLNVGYQKVEPVLQGGRAVSRDTYFLDGSPVGSGTTTPTRINNRTHSPADGALRHSAIVRSSGWERLCRNVEN